MGMEAFRVVTGGGASGKAVANVPHSVAAEQALLAAIMVNNRAFDDLHGRLESDHFYVPLHAAVFQAMDAIINGRGGEANPITISERLKGTPFDADNALFPHLTVWFENAALTANVEALANVILTSYRQRQLMGLAESLHAEARAAARDEDVELVLETASSELFRLSEVGGRGASGKTLREGLLEVVEQAYNAKQSGTGITGVPSGFSDLDRLLSGFQKSDLIVLGARPSMGKTSLLLNIAHHVASRCLRGEENGCPVGVFSLEMSQLQLLQRIAAAAMDMPAQQLANGQLSERDIEHLVKAVTDLSGLPLHIDDTPALTISALRSRARQMKRKHGIGLIIVDYLQLLQFPLKGDYNRVQEITKISHGLKQLARELDVPVLVASQLSRQVESRDNKRPQLSDLRESGSIEQDADVVMMLYREEFYLSRVLGGQDEMHQQSINDRNKLADLKNHLEQVKGLSELLIPKNRKGPTDTVRLMFDGATTTFRSYSSR